MDEKALAIVREYIRKHTETEDRKWPFDTFTGPFNVFIVWKCKTLQNWKWLISTDLSDGMYYEVTYDGDKQKFYLDAYKKFENVVIDFQ